MYYIYFNNNLVFKQFPDIFKNIVSIISLNFIYSNQNGAHWLDSKDLIDGGSK